MSDPIPALASHLLPLKPLPDTSRLNLAIALPLRRQSVLTNYLRDLYDPRSPIYRRYLTPVEFAEEFGPTPQDYQTLVAFARSNHLQVTRTHPNRTILDLNASVADLRRVFGVNIKVYQHPVENRTFYAPDAAPTIDLPIPILAIKGLDSFNLPRPGGEATPSLPAPTPFGGTGTNGLYLGTNFRAAYVPGVTLTGAGQTAAVIEFDDYFPSDITNYNAHAGLSGITLSNVMVDGFADPPSFQNDEVAGDIEILSSMAPGLSRILVYEEQIFSPVDDMLNQIATDNSASEISCSWSFISADAATDQIFEQYAAQGQSFFCASGDFGAYTPTNFHNPVGSPYITIVGGTVLATGSTVNWTSETVWSGTGGGFTANYPIPSWQAGVSMVANQGSTVYRNIPDVAMCATNIYVVANQGRTESFRGTSASAPLWAGFVALVNQQAAAHGDAPVGFLNPAIYAIGASAGYATNFHDIVSGNNTNSSSPSNFLAVAGYDLCTGWGTPNGSNLINTLAPPDPLVMQPITGFASTGPASGPFSMTTENFDITNVGPGTLTWSLGVDSAWVSVTPTNGTLTPGAGTSIVVTLNSTASSLVLGDYAAHLTLSNLSNGDLHYRTFTLHVSDPLLVTASPGLSFGGPPGGPFNVSAQSCLLTNTGLQSVSWAFLGGPPWLNVSPDHGTLNPNGSMAISCSPNANAADLPQGAYAGAVQFTNLTAGAAESAPSSILVGPLLLNGGFETGDFAEWSSNGDTSYIDVTNDPSAVHSGSLGAWLGTSGSPGYLSQNIPTAPGQYYSVSLWLSDADGMTPNGFSLSWGGAVLCQLTNLTVMTWTNLQFIVPATNALTPLQIQFQDDTGELSLDDVSVTAAPPTITGISPGRGPTAGGTVVSFTGTGFQNRAAISFGAIPATAVVVQSTTNLTATTPGMPVGSTTVTLVNGDGQFIVLTNGFTFVGTPAISWPAPSPLQYGLTLDASRLNATANVPGAFAYHPPAGTAPDSGNQVLSVVFTPLDTNDYYAVTSYTNLTVGLAPLAVTAYDNSRLYGLTNPVLTGAISGVQNADSIFATYTSGATSATPPGIVPIVAQLADPDHRLTNYQVNIVDGSLTILPVAPPVFQGLAHSGGSLTFTWSAIPTESYQVQYNSVLTATNWVDLNDPILATNSTVSITDWVPDPQRYYRVLLVPQ